MRRGGITTDGSIDELNPINYYDRIETKKKKVLSQLPEKLEEPYKEREKQKRKLSKWVKKDPLRKIWLTNKRSNKSKTRVN